MMCRFNLKICLCIWVLKSICIACIEEPGWDSAITEETQGKKDSNKCDGNPLLTDSSQGRTIFMIVSSTSGMNVLANVDSPQYRAACWLIYDDLRQLDPLDNSYSAAIVQRYVIAVLYYSTQGSAWHNTCNFLSRNNECEWNNYVDGNDHVIGALCDESGNIYSIDLRKC